MQRGVGAAHPPVVGVGGDGVGLLLGGGVAVVGVGVDALLDDGDGLPPLGEAADASFPARLFFFSLFAKMQTLVCKKENPLSSPLKMVAQVLQSGGVAG